ncbi:MAG TPA: Uma2 family endonuclease [Thermodesulfovibrionia bacterium]|nr:Uma2 family endonuclease [Thermodesulfovibrionia bacterium]
MQHEAIRLISEDEYLEQERASETKSEYFRGEVFAMAGASREHNMIVANIIAELVLQLKKRQCIVYPSDMRLKVEQSGLYTYPDVMVVCDKEEFSDKKKDTLLNPVVIIEVLSDSTERYDRGEKFFNYRQVDSLKEYVLVWQKRQKIEKYSRVNNTLWTLSETDDNNQSVLLDSIGCKLELVNVYDKVVTV